MRFRGGEFSSGTTGNFQPELTLRSQVCFAACPARSPQGPQPILLQLLLPAPYRLPMRSYLAGDFRGVHTLPQQFGCLPATLLQLHKIPTNSCWISHTRPVTQISDNVTILCDNQ
jgi:hypothetical protein